MSHHRMSLGISLPGMQTALPAWSLPLVITCLGLPVRPARKLLVVTRAALARPSRPLSLSAGGAIRHYRTHVSQDHARQITFEWLRPALYDARFHRNGPIACAEKTANRPLAHAEVIPRCGAFQNRTAKQRNCRPPEFVFRWFVYF